MAHTLKINTKFVRAAIIVSFLLPLVTGAQGTDLFSILDTIRSLVNFIIPILMILATVVFLWGIITYVTAAGDEEKLASSRTYIIWGLIALMVMAAVWGLVNVLLSTFGVDTPGTPEGPVQF